MKPSLKHVLILLSCSIGQGIAQSQIITPDNQVVSFQSANGTTNLFIGQSTSAVIGGTFNTFMGSQAGQGNTTGSYNTYFGYKAGFPNTSGSHNTFVGYEAGKLNIDGDDNVFIGYNAGHHNQRGRRNLIIGPNAGFDFTDGEDNTFLGANAMGAGGSLSNATAIGANARVLSSNAMVLGNNVNVGIGTSTPQNRLELTAGVDGRSGLRLTNLTADSPTSGGATTKFLTVSSQGDVTLSGHLSALAMQVKPVSERQWADYVFAPGYRLRSLPETEKYIQQYNHLPDVPSAGELVKDGIDLTTLLAILVKKNEELTLHVIEQQKRIERLEAQQRKRVKTR
ncbi:hypothetical protein [Spirosoma sp.]|uniref:hypothetical protein n=1 Tax=Spirosoma sp. TaxID=1899569 RepID=UPI0026038529|nr:hypothetical protein [Spirosoma sp.]MCX6217776.1 hypothetical protein [Spirosoma sp.]